MTDRYTPLFEGQDAALAASFNDLWWSDGGLEASEGALQLEQQRKKSASDRQVSSTQGR